MSRPHHHHPHPPLPAVRNYYGRSALPLGDESYAKVAAWFLGPKGENRTFMQELLTTAVGAHADFRAEYYNRDDPHYITDEIKGMQPYLDAQGLIRDKLAEMIRRLHYSVPFYSMHYLAHMNWDTLLPANVGYFAAMLFNQNNVATEASPETSKMELEVATELCGLFGFDTDVSWGHITADGTIANLESMWVARNLKSYPLSLRQMLEREGDLAAGRAVTVEYRGESRPLLELSEWQALNLTGDAILALPAAIAALCWPEMAEDERTEKLFGYLKPYQLQSRGLMAFALDFPTFARPQVLVPATKHYSWPKSGTLLGIGGEAVIDMTMDTDCRMDMALLEAHLRDAATQQRPVLMVVAVLGSTTEGAMDRLDEIVALRQRLYDELGLWFSLHADAAWGGYLATMMTHPRRLKKAVAAEEETGFVPVLRLSQHAERQFAALYQVDTVTVDPHKAGFVPYPAGALCYRSKEMRSMITYGAAYLNSAADLNMGIYGVEGSKPGAAPAAVWMAHQCLGLHPEGYGRLLGECMFSSKVFYCYWLTLAQESDLFRIVPIVALPAELSLPGGTVLHGEAEMLAFIRSSILGRDNEELAQDADAMEFLREVGTDVLINPFTINFRKEVGGPWNSDPALGREFTQRVFSKCSIIDPKDPVDINIILTMTELTDQSYQLAGVAEKLGLNFGGEGIALNVLVNTVLHPWPTTHDFVEAISGGFRNTLNEEAAGM